MNFPCQCLSSPRSVADICGLTKGFFIFLRLFRVFCGKLKGVFCFLATWFKFTGVSLAGDENNDSDSRPCLVMCWTLHAPKINEATNLHCSSAMSLELNDNDPTHNFQLFTTPKVGEYEKITLTFGLLADNENWVLSKQRLGRAKRLMSMDKLSFD